MWFHVKNKAEDVLYIPYMPWEVYFLRHNSASNKATILSNGT